VILHRITLRNVGVYGGEHRIELTPPDADHPVILIGALNGGGKTTLLGALQLALYGARSRGIERSRKGYQRYLRDLIHRDADPAEGASVTLEFERRINGRPVHYGIRRSWAMEEGNLHESLAVKVDGQPDPLEAAHWDETIDAYLPARLAHLFFFDGEQIERLADEEAATELLASAFQSLLGLDLVGRLQEDLAILERRKKVQLRPPKEQKRLAFMEEEVESAELALDSARQKFAGHKSAMERHDLDLQKKKSEFKSNGGEWVAARDTLDAERASVVAERKDVEERIREVAAGPAPFLLATGLIQELRAQAARETGARRERIVADAEEARDTKVLAALAAKAPAKVCQTVAELLEQHRPQRDLLDTPLVLNAEEDFLSELDELLKVDLPRAQVSLEKLSADWNSLDNRIDALDRKLAIVPDVDALSRVQREIIALESEIRSLEEARRELEEGVSRAEFDLRLRQSALRKETDEHAVQWEDEDHDRRILDRIPKVNSTLEKFRAKVVARHVGALERAIFESFQHLIRKPKLVGAISIDPSTFAIGLTDGEGRDLPFNLLSAGERQLLATSILWGLAKVSGRPVPLMIDTPLGRLDSRHRSHVVQRYFPAASHQVILLSTDEEIVGRYHAMIEPAVGRHLLIELCADDRKLIIENSYFKN